MNALFAPPSVAQPFCPHCGYNIAQDTTVHAGHWSLGLDSTLFGRRRLTLTPCESAFLHTLAAAKGRVVKAEVVGTRISECEDPENLARVMAHRLRKKLPVAIGRVPFETVRCLGYRWVG